MCEDRKLGRWYDAVQKGRRAALLEPHAQDRLAVQKIGWRRGGYRLAAQRMGWCGAEDRLVDWWRREDWLAGAEHDWRRNRLVAQDVVAPGGALGLATQARLAVQAIGRAGLWFLWTG